MTPGGTRTLGGTTVRVSRLGLGSAPLGDLFTHVGDDEAHAVLDAALDAGMTLIDTAPYYGVGLSEQRIGRFVRSVERNRVILATKVGRVLHRAQHGRARREPGWVGGLDFAYRFDYGYDGVLQSYEGSLQRLGVERVEMLAIHDLDSKHWTVEEFEARLHELERGGVRALEELRTSRGVEAVGLGINTLGSIPRVLEVIDLDYAIVAMPYTLLDQDALEEELPLCLERNVSVIVGAVFASGVLAVDEGSGPYGYAAAPREIVDRVGRMRAVCERNGASLAAAALQFPLAHPAVAAVIPGAISAEQVRQNVARLTAHIPDAVWEELKAEGLLHPDAPVPSEAAPAGAATSTQAESS